MTAEARGVVRELFELFLGDPGRLPVEWRQLTKGPRDPATARVVADYVAGMTDRYALGEHERLVKTGTEK